MKKVIISTLLVLFLTQVIRSQTLLKGVVKEKQGDKELPLPFANVFLEGTTTGTTTNFDGQFELPVEAGTYKLSFSFIGYQKVSKDLVSTGEGEIAYDVTLSAGGEQLQEVKVEAKINRESETMLLMEQKKAAVAVESIGARELSIKGISDAAGAVTKVTGITRQEGTGTLNVRGLGDRYNTTTLNRLPIPSNNAEVKNVDLSLFSTDVISHINIDKTYTSSIYGDFGGANINIVSKKLTSDSFFNVDVKSSQNSSMIGLEKMYLPDGGNSTGFYRNDLPNIDAMRKREAYGFQNSLNLNESDVLPNIGLGISGGKRYQIGEGKLNAFFTAAFENEKSFTERIERMVTATGTYITNAMGEEFSYSTQSNAMLNLNYDLGKNSFYLNSMMLNSSKAELTNLSGEVSGEIDEGFKRRSDFERNLIIVNQLLGEHEITKSIGVDWGLAYNRVLNNVPDRRENLYSTYTAETNIGELDTESAGANYRYFHEFRDNAFAANLLIHKAFGLDEDGKNYKSKLSLGYSGKLNERGYNNYQFNHGVSDPIYVNVDDMDKFFNEENLINGEYKVTIANPRNVNGESINGEGYIGQISVNSAFGLFEYKLNERLLFLLGLRGESVSQKITTRADQITGIGSNEKTFHFDKIKVLPSLSMKYNLSKKQNLRFAASKTYTLPQMQEMPFMSFTGISDEVFGNPYLKPSDVYNVDLKWEVFPKNGELLSVTAFGKYINDPINKTTFGGLDGQYVTANTGDWAYVYGLEIEAKKNLFKQGRNKVFVAGNVSLMETLAELNATKMREETEYNFTANFNHDESALQGAAPLLGNVSLGYNKSWNENSVSTVAVYNYTSDRLYAFGQDNVGDEYIQAINTLDIVIKTRFKRLGIDFSAKNLLDSDYTRIVKNRIKENKDRIIRQYKNGISFTLSMKYNL